MSGSLPCDACVRRAWLVAALAGHLEIAWRSRRPLRDVLALADAELITALGGAAAATLRARHEALDVAALRRAWSTPPSTAVCRHDARYPQRLRGQGDAPAIVFCAGDPGRLASTLGTGDGEHDPAVVSIVGTRRPLPEATEMAQGLGRGMAVAGVTVVSGMAMGVDTAAHVGALEVGGPTVAVLACGPERAYPRTVARVHRQLVESQLVISELPPGTPPWRWAFPARNRIIAALGQATVVVEAAERSGSLITADFAADLGREIGAVPGRAGSPRTRGSNRLLAQGAAVILEPGDVLDLVLGPHRPAGGGPTGVTVPPHLRAVLAAVRDGTNPAAEAATPEQADLARVGLLELELLGLVRRAAGGGHVAVP